MPPLPGTSPWVPLTAHPDPRATLADGVLIQGSVRGRVFGLSILKIDTTVILSPAQIDGAAGSARVRLPPNRARSPTEPAPGGRRLAEAVRTIGEGAAQLADTRRACG